MSSVGNRDTKPEMVVRRALHAAGLRYRLHVATLPGKPDIVLKSRHLAIFVHGCFWHDCPRCRRRKQSKSNLEYWTPKLARNRKRDKSNARALRRMDWKIATLWECETRSAERLERFVWQVAKMRH
jgi:DNA mismatch endonuclease (patch repair protein)